MKPAWNKLKYLRSLQLRLELVCLVRRRRKGFITSIHECQRIAGEIRTNSINETQSESDAISTGHLSVEQLKYILENSQPKLLANIDELSDKAMAASIGQVHQARALNGELWAIKVQFPDIGPILMDELNTLIRLLRKAQLVNMVLMQMFTSETWAICLRWN